MTRAPALLRAPLLLLSLTVFALAPLSGPSAWADSARTAVQAPAAPQPPQPEPGPAPAPGPRPKPKPEPAPGPTPAPGRPTPGPEQPSAPEPTPSTTPPACVATGTECSTATGWSLFDLPGMVVDAVTSFLGMLIEQIMKPVREFLADTLLATPDVTRHADIKRLWKAMLATTAGLYVLFVTAGGITVMSHETFQTRYALRQIAPRLLLGMVASTTSLTVMGKAIGLSNALAHAIMATGLADAGQGMVEQVLPYALFGTEGLQLYLLIIATVMIVLVLAVLIGFLVRVAVMALLAVSAPLALACHAHPLADPVARLWWRALGGCLVIQVAQSMTFVLSLKLFFAPGTTALGIPKADQLGTPLAGVALFWVLFKIPGWTLQVILRGTPAHSPHSMGAVRMLKHLAMYQLLNAYAPGAGQLLSRTRRGGGGAAGGLGGAGLGPGLGGRPGGGGGRPGRGPGGGGGRPPGSGPGASGGGRPRNRGRSLLARGRAALSGSAPPGQSPRQPAPVGPATRGRRRAGAPGAPRPNPTNAGGTRPPQPTLTAAAPGAAPRRAAKKALPHRGTAAAPLSRAPKGPRAVIHPAQARRVRQLALPISTPRAPTRPARPTQTWLPIRAERVPVTPPPARPPTSPPPSTPRTRQLALPVPAPRVRTRPPRPMQLRLPLEPPRR
ncbi:hypothetical protein OK074_4616 [Actinobacteria bacterium OK074]|nr:hypothetical protein OK074_4616 [Actinobacteria bacterium OK074]